MHELGIVFHIIRQRGGSWAARTACSRVNAVTLELGEVSGVVERLPPGLLELGGCQVATC